MNVSKRQSVIYCTSAILSLSMSTTVVSAQQQAAPMVLTDQADKSGAPGIDQFTVAQQIKLDSIPSTDPILTKAMAADDLTTAAKWLGYNGGFQGTVAKVYVTPDKREIMLDFNSDWHKASCALLKLPAYGQFPDMRTLQGKHLLIMGRWVSHKNQPVIQLFKPSQIKIIQDATAAKPAPATEPAPASQPTPAPVATASAATTPTN